MNNYRDKFKDYLDDLSKRKPSPGGGSALCLAFCAGVSLIEKAVNYSFIEKSGQCLDNAANKKLEKQLINIHTLRGKIYPYIDKDGNVFEKIMKTKGERRLKYLKESEEIMVDVAKACKEVFLLANKIESGIKKSIISDFIIGLNFVKVAFSGCVFNLEANSDIFGRKNRHIDSFRKILNRWQ